METAARSRREPAENASDVRSVGDRPPFPAGFRFGPNGRYEVVGVLGSGATAHVLLSRDSTSECLVATKCFRLANGEGVDESFRRARAEARTLETLRHENIVRLRDVDRWEDTAYVVLDYEEGVSLEALLARGPLPLRRALDVTLQVARALEHAHSVGVLHLDVKPGNVWVRRDGCVKVIDFGIHAELVRSQSTSRSNRTLLFGTPAYMSPEQWQLKLPDERSDVWALGTTLFELLTGDLPFADACDHGLLLCEAIVKSSGPRPIGEHLNAAPALDELLHHALANDARERFQSMRELRLAIEDLAKNPSAPFGYGSCFVARHGRPESQPPR